MLVYYMFMLVLYFIYLFNVDHHGGRSRSYAYASLPKTNTDRRHAYVIHSAMILLPSKSSRMVSVYWQIAFYSYMPSHLAS
jgi:hypothetical protein